MKSPLMILLVALILALIGLEFFAVMFAVVGASMYVGKVIESVHRGYGQPKNGEGRS